jgi:hypothetical protein
VSARVVVRPISRSVADDERWLFQHSSFFDGGLRFTLDFCHPARG